MAFSSITQVTGTTAASNTQKNGLIVATGGCYKITIGSSGFDSDYMLDVLNGDPVSAKDFVTPSGTRRLFPGQRTSAIRIGAGYVFSPAQEVWSVPTGTTMYVDDLAGDDSNNDGLTLGAPLKTLEHAVRYWAHDYMSVRSQSTGGLNVQLADNADASGALLSGAVGYALHYAGALVGLEGRSGLTIRGNAANPQKAVFRCPSSGGEGLGLFGELHMRLQNCRLDGGGINDALFLSGSCELRMANCVFGPALGHNKMYAELGARIVLEGQIQSIGGADRLLFLNAGAMYNAQGYNCGFLDDATFAQEVVRVDVDSSLVLYGSVMYPNGHAITGKKYYLGIGTTLQLTPPAVAESFFLGSTPGEVANISVPIIPQAIGVAIPNIVRSMADIARDYVTDGVPSSGLKALEKGDLRVWGTAVENTLRSQIRVRATSLLMTIDGTSGNDDNDGLSGGAAKKTLASAVSDLHSRYDLAGSPATLQLEPGTYAGFETQGHPVGYHFFYVQARIPGTVTLLPQNNACALIGDYGCVIFRGIKYASSGPGQTAVSLHQHAIVDFMDGIEFGAFPGGYHVVNDDGPGIINFNADYTISGGAVDHLRLTAGGIATFAGSKSWYFANTPAFTNNFLELAGAGCNVIMGPGRGIGGSNCTVGSGGRSLSVGLGNYASLSGNTLPGGNTSGGGGVIV